MRLPVARPFDEVRTVQLVERQRKCRTIDRQLDELARVACHLRFGSNPLGFCRLGGPDDDDHLCRSQLLFDDVAVGSVRRQLSIIPDVVAERAKLIGDQPGLGLG